MDLKYGDAGLLAIPWLDFSVPLYRQSTKKKGQEIVDDENSAIIKYKYGGGHCDYIADHAAQGFDIIKKCGYLTPAVVQTPNSSKIYRWQATMLGTNSGNGLRACSGAKLQKISWSDLCLYTCNDSTGKNITMVFFKLQDTFRYPLYKVSQHEQPT